MRQFQLEQLRECYKFARRMIGNHNPDMIMFRKDWEIFRDDFRGKLGEVALRDYIIEYKDAEINGDVDYDVTPRTQWDITDLTVNGKNISVKSIKGNARFLMIEQFRFDENGNYSYLNNDGKPIVVDMYALVKVSIEPELGPKDMYYRNYDEFFNANQYRKISSSIMGGITHEKFWKIKHSAPKGMRCDINNLMAVCNGQEVDPNAQGTKTEVLQKDNYIIDGMKELEPVINVIRGFDNVQMTIWDLMNPAKK